MRAAGNPSDRSWAGAASPVAGVEGVFEVSGADLCMEAREGAVTSHAAAEGSGSYQPPPPPPPPPTAAAVSEEKPSGMGGLVAAAAAAAAAAAPPGVAMGPPVTAAGTMPKKRGRPRKYGPDGSLLRPLNPIPISASVPAGVEYTPAAKVGAAMKRGRGRAVGLVSKSPQFGLELEPQGTAFPHLTTLSPSLFLGPIMRFQVED